MIGRSVAGQLGEVRVSAGSESMISISVFRGQALDSLQELKREPCIWVTTLLAPALELALRADLPPRKKAPFGAFFINASRRLSTL